MTTCKPNTKCKNFTDECEYIEDCNSCVFFGKEQELYSRILRRLEKLRIKTDHRKEPMDYTIRLCESIVAEEAGYKNRMEWAHLQEVS